MELTLTILISDISLFELYKIVDSTSKEPLYVAISSNEPSIDTTINVVLLSEVLPLTG